MTSHGDLPAGEYDEGYRHGSGQARVPGSADGYDHEYVDPGYYAAPVSARASVPVATGRAAVSGRASVRTAASPYGDDEVEQQPRKGGGSGAHKRKQARLQKLLIAGFGVFILLVGGGLIGGGYFYDRVPRPEELSLKNSTEVFAADNTTQLAKLGSEHRSEVPMSKLKEEIKHALIAGEDKNFYKHHGVDLWGIARAAWNNLTGGETQGGSTITQQYARQAAQDLEVTYARKLREAVMARKIEDQYSKEEILGFYLNTVYFGRGAHGVGAAYEVYFGKPADDIGNMTVAQAAVLGAVLKQPEGKSGYDPAVNPNNAKERWNYVLSNMVDNQWLAPQVKAQLKFPAPANPEAPAPGELQKPNGKGGGAWGYTDRGTGHVVDQVEEELEAKGVLKELGTNNWRNAGLRITTTIDPIIQAALELQLNREVPNSRMSKERENIVGAGVVIEPKTGRVMAYYGGTNNGSGIDYAGEQAHPPASSFKIYTLAAALKDGISIRSRWDPTELERSKGDPIDLGNANRDSPDSCGTSCTLEEMTVASYNVPFYKIASPRYGIGHQKVVAMAHAAGVKTMWGIDGKAYDISNGGPFDPYVGIGKFPITVFDHAVGTATFAAGGVYHKPHFIMKVQRKNKKTGAWEKVASGDERDEARQVIPRDIADEVTTVLKKIPVGQYALSGGRESAGKTGTWENGLMKPDGKTPVYPKTNAHVWFTGYTAQLSATIWLGSKDENKTPIKMAGTGDLLKATNMQSSYPKTIWKDFMNQVHKDKAYKYEKLAPNHRFGRIGSEDRGDGGKQTQNPWDCSRLFPRLCPTRPPRDR